MQLSSRLQNITAGGPDGWDILYRARDMIAAGHPVTDLTQGEHDVRTEPKILSKMYQSARAGHTGYAEVPGTPSLRSAVAARIESRTGVPTSLDNILITPGGQSALFAAHHATCDEGDIALYIDPYYATYPGTIRGVGATPVAVRSSPDNHFQPRASALFSAAADAKSLLINTPNNPTGAVYGRQTLETIAEVCQQHDLWLISDEVYDTQVWQGEHLSPRALPSMRERTLVVGSMSKSHAMTGSRIGWICADKTVIAHLSDLATHTTYGVPGYIQDAALFALESGEVLEEQVRAPFRRRREAVMALIATQNRVKVHPCDGAMYVMLDVRCSGLSGDAFANALLSIRGVAVMPGESFGAAAAGHVRVAMTCDDEALLQAVAYILELAAQSR